MKKGFRKQFLKQLHELGAERRKEASDLLLQQLDSITSGHSYVLSFANMPREVNTLPINQALAKQGRLLLPRIAGEELHIFPITDLNRELEPNDWGLMQPASSITEEIDLSLITLALVPALGFDRRNHRIGYGKGYYDRFLRNRAMHAETIGIGFKEQFYDGDFPESSHDVQLGSILLF